MTVADGPPAPPDPRVYAFAPARITGCGECGRQGHHTAAHDTWAAKTGTAEPSPERKADTAPGPVILHPAIIASLEAGGFTGHATAAALYDSVFTKGDGLRVAAEAGDG